jgi:hypothetical protein
VSGLRLILYPDSSRSPRQHKAWAQGQVPNHQKIIEPAKRATEIWSAVASRARHRFGFFEKMIQSAVDASLCRRTPELPPSSAGYVISIRGVPGGSAARVLSPQSCNRTQCVYEFHDVVGRGINRRGHANAIAGRWARAPDRQYAEFFGEMPHNRVVRTG